jgi:hypothetical protein
MVSISVNALPDPTYSSALGYASNFDADPRSGAPARALSALFALYPLNVDLEHVLLKVSSLNGLYSTNIYAVTEVSQQICDKDIDPLLRMGDTAVVDLVALVRLGGKPRRNYSFATKYCSLHSPAAFPIYDTIVDELLWRYMQRDRFASFRRKDLVNYDEFRRVIDEFREHYGLRGLDYKSLDKFLWMMGRELLSVR